VRAEREGHSETVRQMEQAWHHVLTYHAEQDKDTAALFRYKAAVGEIVRQAEAGADFIRTAKPWWQGNQLICDSNLLTDLCEVAVAVNVPASRRFLVRAMLLRSSLPVLALRTLGSDALEELVEGVKSADRFTSMKCAWVLAANPDKGLLRNLLQKPGLQGTHGWILLQDADLV